VFEITAASWRRRTPSSFFSVALALS
jgi:hypothetical protein